MLISNVRLVDRHRVAEPGWIECQGETIVDRGIGAVAEGLDLGGRLVTPGFVDLHVHGGAGADFGDASPIASAAARAFHLRHGTTTMLAAVTTGSPESMRKAVVSLAHFHRQGQLAGTFLEGPFLSTVRRGAHDPSLLRAPDAEELATLLDAAEGSVRMVTLAPELPGAGQVVRLLAGAGVTAAFGHTDATYDQAREAIDQGVTVATHLFNGMRPVHHREPGVAVAAMADERVTCEVIADGVHLADSMLHYVFETVGADRVALVTDAIRAAGEPDGDYFDGTMSIVVSQGKAMLQDGSSLAGSTLTMDAALRRAVLRAGISLPDAIRAATATPAKALGIDDRAGSIAPGRSANLVVLNDDLRVHSVLRRGQWVS